MLPPREPVPSRAADLLAARLRAVVRRMRTADALHAISAGAGGALVGLLALVSGGVAVRAAALISAGAGGTVAVWFLARRRHSWTAAAAAGLFERVRPESRNVIVTAEELQRRPGSVRPAIVARVAVAAAAEAATIAPGAAVPLSRPVSICAAAVLAWTVAVLVLPHAPRALRHVAGSGAERHAGAPGPIRIVATLSPPAYLQTEPMRLEDPERIEAMAGTRLAIEVTGRGRKPGIRLGSAAIQTSSIPDGLAAEVTLRETTYLAIEDAASADTGGRRLLPVVVVPDRAPTIRIEQPGKDLLLPSAKESISVAATATDDFGLASMELRYTRISGSGEQFEFEEGVIPLRIDRENDRAWKGSAALPLARLALQPGDAVVYRIVGADRRGGQAGAASSETFFVEIAGPGQVTLAGFELPPDRERSALSQQMILLKIGRLRARERSMAREAVAGEAAGIAAEQRSVRASFIFLTGGHVEDEEAEAEHSHEIQEGRLEHGARREITAAIGYMSRVEQELAGVDIAGALPPARAAVEALQRAFARNRYFLRTLPVRSRLDPSRRLTGDLSGAADSRRDAAEADVDPGRRAAREILSALLDLKRAISANPSQSHSTRLTALAERALAVDAAAEEWQAISAALLLVRDAISTAAPAGDIDAQLAHAAGLIGQQARGTALAVAPDPRGRHLRGAWFDGVGRR